MRFFAGRLGPSVSVWAQEAAADGGLSGVRRLRP